MSSTTDCRQARPEDFEAVSNLLELYQYELSNIWDQDLDAMGRYGYALDRHREGLRFFAHLALVEGRPAGFALVAPAIVTQTEGHWMEQFFILKKHRRGGLGQRLAEHVFLAHPGPWEVGQMAANREAQAFWRSAIGRLTGGQFTEVRVTEGWWQGVVQRFNYAETSGTS